MNFPIWEIVSPVFRVQVPDTLIPHKPAFAGMQHRHPARPAHNAGSVRPGLAFSRKVSRTQNIRC
jgi:hypothetical protein